MIYVIVVDVSIANAVVLHIQIDIVDVGGDRLDMMDANFGIGPPRKFAQVGINGQFLWFLIDQFLDIQIVSEGRRTEREGGGLNVGCERTFLCDRHRE